ncbi:MAG TPA: acetyl-CoA hydrolase/transferase C-terminal domain-containing protein [Nocardioides sp.]|nr:acetyl-CoA hydrolase/transferase C-terminal domain-containing protein [Nocardioides sp.]
MTLDQLATHVRNGWPAPRVVAPGNFATPWPVIKTLDSALERWTLHMLNAQKGVPVREGLTLETCFVGPGMRGAPTLSYVPCRLSMVPLLLKRRLAPDIVVLHTSTPRGDTVSLGTEVNILPGAIEAVRSRGGLVVAAVNPHMPYTYGDAVVPLHDIDLMVEVDEPLQSPAPFVLDDASRLIGARVAARVQDHSTLQAGIGAIPDAALQGLLDRRGLRVWSEMISDGVLALESVGALDVLHPVCASFLFGSPELYDWVDDNHRVRMVRTEKANDPARIANQHAMVSINSALQVDLCDQANACRMHGRIYSGLGGQSDFVVGSLHSPGGQALIALRSWHPKADCSTIVPLIAEPATSFLHTAVITEHGTAEIWGSDQAKLSREIIEHAADPRARDELTSAAAELGLS